MIELSYELINQIQHIVDTKTYSSYSNGEVLEIRFYNPLGFGLEDVISIHLNRIEYQNAGVFQAGDVGLQVIYGSYVSFVVSIAAQLQMQEGEQGDRFVQIRNRIKEIEARVVEIGKSVEACDQTIETWDLYDWGEDDKPMSYFFERIESLKQEQEILKLEQGVLELELKDF
nr:hypothetical protein [Moritella viscosa]SHO15717.1 Translation initiation factor IF-2 [Moritella viscosa]